MIVHPHIQYLALGGFDGLHLAHQAILQQLPKNHNDIKHSAALVIEKGNANLTPGKSRIIYTDLPLIFVDLIQIKHFSGLEFCEYLQKYFPRLKQIVVGYDFRFGFNRDSTAKDLQDLMQAQVRIIDPIKLGDQTVHSHKIRHHISNGDINKANAMLTRAYSITGKIIKGQGLGSRELLPTFNIAVQDFLVPQNGVYITQTKLAKTSYNSVSFVGNRLSTDNQPSIESHILGENISTNEASLSISFLKYLRANKKFDNLEDLKHQILADIEVAKSYFSQA